MNVFLIGGTGLLGLQAAKELIRRGHHVEADALPPLPVGAEIPEELVLNLRDSNKRTDEEWKKALKGVDCFIFAAGIDERVECPPPVAYYYDKYNVAPLRRILPIAKEMGVKKAVVLGSYFSMLHHPEHGYDAKLPKGLLERNPYIKKRIEQEEVLASFADESFDCAVLELPYIFGTQPGRQPVWTVLIEQIEGMDKLPFTMYPKGGTAMVTVGQVGQAIAGAAEKLGNEFKGFHAWPIGMVNYTWKQFLRVVYEARGMGPNRKIVGVPAFVMKMGMGKVIKDYKKRGIEGGLDPKYLPYIMNLNLFIDDSYAKALGVEEADIDEAIADSVHVSVACHEGKAQLLGMKGENPEE
ncbi:MAG: NAD(P)H-binding protein [Bacilli bacterium]|nr:NAD(P)H-binding protein [Bacilli bacterium]